MSDIEFKLNKEIEELKKERESLRETLYTLCMRVLQNKAYQDDLEIKEAVDQGLLAVETEW